MREDLGDRVTRRCKQGGLFKYTDSIQGHRVFSTANTGHTIISHPSHVLSPYTPHPSALKVAAADRHLQVDLSRLSKGPDAYKRREDRSSRLSLLPPSPPSASSLLVYWFTNTGLPAR